MHLITSNVLIVIRTLRYIRSLYSVNSCFTIESIVSFLDIWQCYWSDQLNLLQLIHFYDAIAHKPSIALFSSCCLITLLTEVRFCLEVDGYGLFLWKSCPWWSICRGCRFFIYIVAFIIMSCRFAYPDAWANFKFVKLFCLVEALWWKVVTSFGRHLEWNSWVRLFVTPSTTTTWKGTSYIYSE